MIDSAFRLLAATVACDFTSAFYQRSNDGLLKERDSRGRTYDLAFMRRYVELTPALPFARANRGVALLRTRELLPESMASLHASAFYREVMQPQGWRHGVALCFWGQPAGALPLLVASVYRREGQRDFSGDETARLERIHPFIDCAVNNLSERDLYRSVHEGMAMVIADESRGFAILNRDLEAVQVTAVARLRCAAWLEATGEIPASPPTTWRLPTALAATCHDLHNGWQSLLHVDSVAAGIFRRRRVVSATTAELTASVTLTPATGLSDPTFVIEFHDPTPAGPVDSVDQALRLLERLTPAERAVAVVAARGCSNQEVADRLGKTVHAVKFLLHKIYKKCGVPSRAALAAILRSNRQPPNDDR
jgi:DNA-binding CsgD family transcriptional regulator